MKVYRKFLLFIPLILILIWIYQSNKSHGVQFHLIDEPTPIYASDAILGLQIDYTVNNACENTDILAVFIVTSYLGNVETRSAMRRAFSSEKLAQIGLHRVFLLGLAPEDKYTSQKAILNENSKFHDIVQGSFVEAYRNLTYKHLMGLRWASRYCPQAKYVVKMDDDIVTNVYKLRELLVKTKFPKDLIGGYILKGMSPIREPANKWFVTNNEYTTSTYPTFVSGWLYVTTPRICTQLVETSLKLPFFWIDDVFVTGILAQRLHIRPYNLKEIFTVHPEFLECCVRDANEFNYDCDVLVGPNGGNNDLFSIFNYAMSKCVNGACAQRQQPLEDTCVAQRKFPLTKGSAFIQSYKLS